MDTFLVEPNVSVNESINCAGYNRNVLEPTGKKKPHEPRFYGALREAFGTG